MGEPRTASDGIVAMLRRYEALIDAASKVMYALREMEQEADAMEFTTLARQCESLASELDAALGEQADTQ